MSCALPKAQIIGGVNTVNHFSHARAHGSNDPIGQARYGTGYPEMEGVIVCVEGENEVC